MNEKKERILDGLTTWCMLVDEVPEFTQSSVNKSKDNVDMGMKCLGELVNLQSENVEVIDKFVVIGSSTAHQNDKEQHESSTNNLFEQQQQ